MDIIFVAAMVLLTFIGWLAPQAQYLTGSAAILVAGLYAVLAYSERRQLVSSTTVDRVTGFLNERAARSCIERECALSQDGRHSLCVITVDLREDSSLLPSDSVIGQLIAELTTRADILVRYGDRKFAIIVRDRQTLQVTEVVVGLKAGLSDPRVSGTETGPDLFKALARIEPIFYRPSDSAAAFISNVYRRFEDSPNTIDLRA
jgi:GGDEF domain-containing protein